MPLQPSKTPRLRIPADRKVLLCVGPGGVGKTTVAASIALRAARLGRRVIVVTIDPSLRLAQALGFAEHERSAGVTVTVPHTGAQAGAIGQPLDALLLDTRSVFDEIVREYSPNPGAASRMLRNPIYLATVQHLGGALEYAAIARVHMLVGRSPYDLVILDTPPTANAIDFLDAPSRIAEVLDNPAARFLATTGRPSMKFLGLASSVMLKAFESLGGGPFIGQLGEFLSDFGGVLQEFRRRAGDVAELLVSPRTGVVLTTAATDFSVREAKAFVDVLRSRRMRIDGVVLNRVDPPVGPMPPPEVVRPVLQAVAPGRDEALLGEVAELHEGLTRQASRAAAVHRDLVGSYPDIPVQVLLRRQPPPTSLADLVAMGEEIIAS